MKKDKKIFNELNALFERWLEEKIDIDREFLKIMFRSEGGILFFNSEEKLGVGLLPQPDLIGVYFFDIIEDDRVKFVGERGICCGEFEEVSIKNIITECRIRGKINIDVDDDVSVG